MIISVVIALVVAIVAVMFSLQNTTLVTVTFFGYPVDGAIGLLMLLTLGVGVLLGILLMLPSMIGRSWALMRHKHKLAELQAHPPLPPVQKPEEYSPEKYTT
jgi:lipopolysaccharide assembly protein A